MPGLPSPAELFDALAATHDQTGIDFFQPVGARLSALLAPGPGERVLDIGCGRGAVTFPLADAVGPEGSVRAVDISPAMAAATQSLASERGYAQVQTEVGDAGTLEGGPYDVVAASLVLFFLPDPAAALASWVRLLGEGGRIGLTTFGTLDEASRALDALLLPYAPREFLDARTQGTKGPFASAQGMADLMRASGASSVQTTSESVALPFAHAAAWERFSRTTAQRAMWAGVPDDELDDLRRSAAEILTGELVWELCFTVGRR
jgi:ubiquinone/menaquinone biosynthesis C-methylase UbiE